MKTALKTITYVTERQGWPFNAVTVLAPKTEEDRKAMLALARADGAPFPDNHPMKLIGAVGFAIVSKAIKERHGITLALESH